MIAAKIRKTLKKIISESKGKKVYIEPLFKAARDNALNQDSDMAVPLYRALIRQGYPVLYPETQQRYHDRSWALQWLGEALGRVYLDQAECVRWPQEGLGELDLIVLFSEISSLKKAL